jgi:hypothetical protein
LNIDPSEHSFLDHSNNIASFNDTQDSDFFSNHSLGESDNGGSDGGGGGTPAETGCLAKISMHNDPLFSGENELHFNPIEDVHRLQYSILNEFGFNQSLDNVNLSVYPDLGEDMQVGLTAFNTGKLLVSDNVSDLSQEQTLDAISGLVCGKLNSNPYEMMDEYFSQNNVIDNCGLQTPEERWDTFYNAYNLAHENPEISLGELITQMPNIDHSSINQNTVDISHHYNHEIGNSHVSFKGGLGICGMQCLNGCSSITTEDNQHATHSELSANNS